MQPSYILARAWQYCSTWYHVLNLWRLNICKYTINIYQFNKYIELWYHSIEKFMMVSQTDIVIWLKLSIPYVEKYCRSAILACKPTGG